MPTQFNAQVARMRPARALLVRVSSVLGRPPVRCAPAPSLSKAFREGGGRTRPAQHLQRGRPTRASAAASSSGGGGGNASGGGGGGGGGASGPGDGPSGIVRGKQAFADEEFEEFDVPLWCEHEDAVGTRSDGTMAPLVILCGWFGARRDHLAKYQAVYRDLGFETVMLFPPVPITIFPSFADAAVTVLLSAASSRSLLNRSTGQRSRQPPKQVDGQRAERPVVVHCFSNGGFLLFGQILRRAEESRRIGPAAGVADATALSLVSAVSGLIMDCTPAPIDPDMAARAIEAVAQRSAARPNSKPGPLAAFLQPIVAWYIGLKPVRSRIGHIERAWAQGERLMRCPTLCVYSKTDVLIPPEAVEEFAKRRMAAGPVALRAFDSAPHVELLRYHPVEYKAAVTGFVQGVLGQWRKDGGSGEEGFAKKDVTVGSVDGSDLKLERQRLDSDI